MVKEINEKDDSKDSKPWKSGVNRNEHLKTKLNCAV
jgi:hypothetical protein